MALEISIFRLFQFGRWAARKLLGQTDDVQQEVGWADQRIGDGQTAGRQWLSIRRLGQISGTNGYVVLTLISALANRGLLGTVIELVSECIQDGMAPNLQKTCNFV